MAECHRFPTMPSTGASRAAFESRFGDNMKSIVSPAESTARYRYVRSQQLLYRSHSTCQEALGRRSELPQVPPHAQNGDDIVKVSPPSERR
jgi:hypothetical protein